MGVYLLARYVSKLLVGVVKFCKIHVPGVCRNIAIESPFRNFWYGSNFVDVRTSIKKLRNHYILLRNKHFIIVIYLCLIKYYVYIVKSKLENIMTMNLKILLATYIYLQHTMQCNGDGNKCSWYVRVVSTLRLCYEHFTSCSLQSVISSKTKHKGLEVRCEQSSWTVVCSFAAQRIWNYHFEFSPESSRRFFIIHNVVFIEWFKKISSQDFPFTNIQL